MRALPYSLDSFRYVCLSYYSPYVLIAGPQAPLPALPRQPDDPILAWVRATCAPVSGFAGLRDCAPR